MRPLCGASLLLLLLTCQLATSTPIFDRDGAGSPSRYRSAGFGESIRDWFRMMKNRIMGKWNEWFGDDTPTLNFSPQDILDIDKTLEKSIPGYQGMLTDLSNVIFDPKQVWGDRFGNWYIRKIAGEKFCSECGTDEWDFRSWLPTLPSFPNFDWNIPGFGTPEPPTTATPRTEFTTIRRQTTQTVTQPEQPPATTTGTTVFIAESTVPSTESTPAATESTTAAFAESTEEISNSNESTTESIVTSTEPIVISTEAATAATTDELEPSATSSTESILTSTESVVTSTESTEIDSDSTVTSMSEEITTTESPTTPFELPLPVVNKRIEDNETIEKSTKRTKARPSSAEVIMF